MTRIAEDGVNRDKLFQFMGASASSIDKELMMMMMKGHGNAIAQYFDYEEVFTVLARVVEQKGRITLYAFFN